MMMACDKKIFLRVCGMCLSHVCIIFLVIAFFRALGFLVVVMTISFALPIDLNKSLWVSENGYFTQFFLKDTKLLL